MRHGNVGVSSKAEFLLYYDKENGASDLGTITIFLGKKVISLEVLIHEVNELEVENILRRWRIENVPIRYIVKKGEIKMLPYEGYDEGQRWTGFVHFICPYGYDSLIYPAKSRPRYKSLLRSSTKRNMSEAK